MLIYTFNNCKFKLDVTLTIQSILFSYSTLFINKIFSVSLSAIKK